jgi:hypothetical protein
MGFNLGVALGAGAQSSVSTFERLNKEARDQKMFDAWQKEQDQKEALTQASSDTYGQVGQNKYDNVEALLAPKEEAQVFAGDGQGQVGADGKPVPVQAIPTQPQEGTTAYTREMADADFTKRAYGINFDMGRKAEREGLDISNARRVDSRGKAEDDFSAWSQNSLAQIQKDPVKWAQDNLKDYNKPPKGGHLDDGMTAEVVQGADGSSSLVQKDTKGKVVSSTPINSQTAMAAFKDIAFAKYQSLPGKFKEGEELNLKGREVGAKELEAKAKAGYYGAAGAAMGKKQTATDVLNEKADAMATGFMGGGTNNPKTGEPFKDTKEARAYALQVLTRDPSAKPSKAEVAAEEVGYIAQDLVKGQEINPATKKPYTVEEADAAAWKIYKGKGNQKPTVDWKVSTDGTMRTTPNGDRVQEFRDGAGWVDKGTPKVSESAASAGVIGAVDAKGRAGFKGADNKWYDNEKDAFVSIDKAAKTSAAMKQSVALEDPTGEVPLPPSARGVLAPSNANERFTIASMYKQGFEPIGRQKNSALGGGTLVFENKKTGERRTANQTK